ncbi:hypothetical protein UVI_02026690 [Ustilaginoidea virens]|uniref:Up-regulated during septation protein 1 domain-containing protein n=1 Tax=Ustilaginoidea virens TaxID=1159556 RepID=A0A1B5L192_USTVR|nr:hypothetical protein UVI_02026690 [Ustilaginoidea virens]
MESAGCSLLIGSTDREALQTTPAKPSTDSKSSPRRRLPTEAKRYQFFPKDKPLPSLDIIKISEGDKLFDVATTDKQAAGLNAAARMNHHNSFRRRKFSVPDLEPMTTVHEVAMDSHSFTSVTGRGRPRRMDGMLHEGSFLQDNQGKRSMSFERRAFEELPKGWKPSEACQILGARDLSTLRTKALGQAERFEVLNVEHVDALSQELRYLDERTEYLRRTYTSLRAGRRNLHSRICQYLRSPRVAKFSHDSMLKQEEALAELDASIDDWVTKLERAENRRTRVRQKLLEHVAAAAILPSPKYSDSAPSTSEVRLQAMGIQSPTGPREPSTPPRSPAKGSFAKRAGDYSPSPPRVVAQVPSTIFEHPVVAEDAKGTARRRDVESIRIYAGDDVYALLADVEDEISKMARNDPKTLPEIPAEKQRSASDGKSERERHRQRSHEKLNGAGPGSSAALASPAAGTPASPESASTADSPLSAAPTPLAPKSAGVAAKRDPEGHARSPPTLADNNDGLFLTAAVFKP